jgi:hypothetical protein
MNDPDKLTADELNTFERILAEDEPGPDEPEPEGLTATAPPRPLPDGRCKPGREQPFIAHRTPGEKHD